jgi:tetratricopeptide (TPR) repeat protein
MTDSFPDIDSLWDYSDPAASEERFRAILPAARESGDDGYLAELLTQVARTYSLRGRFEECHRTLDEAAPLSSGSPRARIRLLLERGRAYNSAGDPAMASGYFRRAWDLATEQGEQYHAADAAHMLGISEPSDRQLEWDLRALDLAESTDEERTRSWLGPLYNNIGWTYHDLGQYEAALDYFARSLAFRRSQSQPRETRIAAWTVARALRSLGINEEALALQQENLRTAEEAGDPDGYIQEEIGECLLNLGRARDAAPHFARAHALLSQDQWLAEHEPERLARLKKLSVP